jgi:hypothetical protein
MSKSVSIAQLKAHLAKVVGEVQSTGRTTVIKKRRRSATMFVEVDATRPDGLLGLIGAFDDCPEFPLILERIVKSRRLDKKRRAPRVG